jgi:hypothetical protein
MSTRNPRPRPGKFGTNAKTVVTTVAVTALLAGWNLVGQLDKAKAEVPIVDEVAAASLAQEASTLATPLPVARFLVDLQPLALAPIPTLAPLNQVLVPGTGGGLTVARPGAPALPAVPGLAALAPLPTMAPLPSLPSLPQAPASNNGNGNSGGSGGAQTSGGS